MADMAAEMFIVTWRHNLDSSAGTATWLPRHMGGVKGIGELEAQRRGRGDHDEGKSE